MKLFHALLSIALAFSATNVASSAAQGDLDKTFNCDVEGDAVVLFRASAVSFRAKREGGARRSAGSAAAEFARASLIEAVA